MNSVLLGDVKNKGFIVEEKKTFLTNEQLVLALVESLPFLHRHGLIY